MKVFYNNKFDGHYPVGASAIVLARNPAHAALILHEELAGSGLRQPVWAEDMIELDLENAEPGCIILADGNH